MSLSDVHRRLADLIDEIEASGGRVVEATPGGTGDDGTVTATLTVELPVGDTTVEASTTVTADASGDPSTDPSTVASTAEMAVPTVHPIRADDAGDPGGAAAPESESVSESASESTSESASESASESVSESEPGPDDEDDVLDQPTDGAEANGPSEETSQIACKHPDCDVTFETPHGMKIHYTKVHVGSDADLPAYRDPERLREAYEACDTLSEIRDALGADVAVTTIRRHLLEHGIHDPATGEETREPEAEPEPTETNAVEEEVVDADAVPAAPDVLDADTEVAPGVTVAEFREALHGAATVSGVERGLNLDRDTTVELLREYDLLDVVGGRVADKPNRESICAEVDDRLRDRLTA